MANNFKSFLLKITKEASQTLPLPSFACFLLEFISQSQIFSLILTQLLTKRSVQTTSHLSQTLNQLLSYLEPLHIFDPFQSESMALAMFFLTIVYILILLGLLFITSLLIDKGKYIKIALSKVLSFLYLLHSRVLFFPIHCFMVKALQLNNNCVDTESLYCNKGWLFGVVLLLILNIIVAIIKEGFCYTVHRDRSHYSMKGNQLPLTILFHKIIVGLLFYLIDNSTDAVVICNVGFCILAYVILQIGLPFYSLQTLKISVICSTICTICALVSFARIPGYKKDLILFTLCLLPIGIKISLILLKETLWTVFQQKSKRPYQAIHLPVLIEEYQNKLSLFPFPQKINSKTLFSLAFIRGNVPEGYNLKDEQEYNWIEAETYKAAISYLTQLSKKYPNDQLLLISMMEIYADILKDTMKAIYTINRLRTHPKLSLAGELSLEMVSGKFEGNQFSIEESSVGKKTIHLDFFTAKTKTAKLKELIQKEVNGHLVLWRQIEGKKVDVMNIIQKANEISSQGKEVSKYWNENFCNYEGIYVSATIIYGLYIQIVQALPFEGLKLARKAYKAIKNRFHTHKEVLDIITGKSAIIAASIEPDKLGKIVDASSSVKKMFRAGKHGLIGTNLNGILPVAVAARHNGFIRNYLYRNSRDELNTQIVNYARTSDGEYFKVKVSLLISPFTQNGLNIVAHVKRLSDNEPIMIIDQEGKIIEYSESLGSFLNINVKREITRIEALYPELERVNHAFNIFYKPEKEQETVASPQRNPLNSASISFEDDFQLDAVKLTGSQVNSPAPQSSRRLLSQTTERSTTKMETKPVASSKTGQWKLLARMVTMAQMGKAEAEEICGKFKDGHEVTYLGGKKPNETPAVGGQIKNKIEIEPLIIDGLIFKVLKTLAVMWE